MLDALGLRKPLVVGHSMGGMMAAEMAAIASYHIDRLCLLCPAGGWMMNIRCPTSSRWCLRTARRAVSRCRSRRRNGDRGRGFSDLSPSCRTSGAERATQHGRRNLFFDCGSRPERTSTASGAKTHLLVWGGRSPDAAAF
ncbi:MAG: alpha/beta fold hydrolase [Gammaproteobacteria bacterium]|nr:alpha/beta fold hydrolase [Gammaproteobacteria bacterium]